MVVNIHIMVSMGIMFGILIFCLFIFFSGQDFSLALDRVLELALVHKDGLELTEICLPLSPMCHHLPARYIDFFKDFIFKLYEEACVWIFTREYNVQKKASSISPYTLKAEL